MKQILFPILLVLVIMSYSPLCAQQPFHKAVASVEKLDAELDKIIDVNVDVEIIAEGYVWSEGPLWVEHGKMLLFSDVPTNTVYKWTEEEGATVYLRPSGYTNKEDSKSREPGSNGLLLDTAGNLVLCQHGDRRIARMEASLSKPVPRYTALVDHYHEARFNSPNDAVYATDGTLFFTDPPYGLPTQGDNDPAKEIHFNGVYRLQPNGKLSILTDLLSRPNGIALLPSQKQLLVSNSDVNDAAWYILDVEAAKAEPKLFYNATQQQDSARGLPDGLKVTKAGIVLASGPGGVWIFSPDAKVLGKIKLQDAVSNVALSEDEKYMYLTNSSRILRVRLK